MNDYSGYKDDYELDNRNNDAKLVFEITFLEATFLLMMSPLIRFIKTNAIWFDYIGASESIHGKYRKSIAEMAKINSTHCQ